MFKRPPGLILLCALLVILTVRSLGWAVIQGVMGGEGIVWGIGLVVLPIIVASVACVVGLLRYRKWARRLTLIVCTIYFGWMLVNVVRLWPRLAGSQAERSLAILNGVGAVAILLWSWWYLTRPDTRDMFRR